MYGWANRIGLLWAGVVLGGSLIAAPAKFQVEALTLPVALQVGRIQFLWVTYAEAACIALGILLWIVSRQRVDRRVLALLGLATLLFAIEHGVLMAPLQTRSDRIIAGEDPGSSSSHIVYVVVESVKFLALLVAGLLPTRRVADPDQDEVRSTPNES